MATAVGENKRIEQSEGLNALKVSAYDRVASMLVALLILVGMAFACLFAAWLSTKLVFIPIPPKPKYIEEPYGRGDHAAGTARDADAPGEEELPELQEPAVEQTLESVTDAVSMVAASMDALDTPAVERSKGKGGLGDSRPPGPLGDGDDIIPRVDRWEIRFESSSLDAYARQLDFFKIEVGAAGGAKLLDYAFNVSKPKPDTRQGEGDKEKRMYMTWRTGKLKEYDKAILAKAGIKSAGRLVMQFYPQETEDMLAGLEQENANGRHPREYLKTVFGIRSAGNRFGFYIIEQRFRPAPAPRAGRR